MRDRDKYLKTATHACNNTSHSGTVLYPMEIVSALELVYNVRRTLQFQKVYKNTKQISSEAKEWSKRKYDKKMNPSRYTLARESCYAQDRELGSIFRGCLVESVCFQRVEEFEFCFFLWMGRHFGRFYVLSFAD